MSRFAAATALLAALPIAAAHAQEQRLVTWNVGGAERTPAEVETSVENLASRIGVDRHAMLTP
jgi:spermidine/putrescine-binding protein